MKIECIFSRRERKYLIDEPVYKVLKDEIVSYSKKERFKKSESVSFVRSVYLDNHHWTTYSDHKNRKKQRFKVRIRQYGLDGEKCFVELKEKIDHVTHKSRFKIEKDSVGDFLKRKDIFSELSAYNRGIAHHQLIGVYQKIRDTVESYQLEPVVRIQYERESFRNKDEEIRITFDRNLSFMAVQNRFIEPVKTSDTYPPDEIIMETKTAGPRPDWLKELVSRYDLKKQRFSKYCTSIESIYKTEPTMNPEVRYAGLS